MTTPPSKTASSSRPPAPSDPTRRGRRLGLGCAIPLGLFFAALGLAGFWPITIEPLRKAAAASSWVETPCEIIESEVIAERGSRGTHYRVAVRFRYEWPPAGDPATPRSPETAPALVFESERYDFADGSGGIGFDPQAAVDALPPGFRTVCFVNPADPAEAVLVRDAPGSAWFGFVMLLFPALGLAVVIGAWRHRGVTPANGAPDAA